MDGKEILAEEVMYYHNTAYVSKLLYNRIAFPMLKQNTTFHEA